MFKVMITQIVPEKDNADKPLQVIGNYVFLKNYRTMEHAMKDAKNALLSAYSLFEIREYSDTRNIISFKEDDTGKMVFHSGLELLKGIYYESDITAVELLDSILKDRKDSLCQVVNAMQDDILTQFLHWAGDTDWCCKGKILWR